MAQNLFGNSATLFLETSQQDVSQKKSTAETSVTQKLPIQKTQSSKPKYQWKIVWRNIIVFAYLHLAAIYGLYILITAARFYTFLWNAVVVIFAAVGVAAGPHRLWSHRSYKAKWPMRIILMLLQTTAYQNHIYEWVRDHRVHHKFMDTDADPHNAKRGFFFSHVGWLLVRKHPDVINKGATIDMNDLEKDPVVIWQRRFYYVLMPVCCFLLPIWVPCHFWNEKPMYSWYATVFRYTLHLNLTWMVNSAAHTWGMKPYDNSISPTDSYNFNSAFGESWHNFHHVFPWDYKAAELGNRINFTTAFIDFFAWIGWAYDLKTVTHSMIQKRAARTGDGSKYQQMDDHHDEHHHTHEIWGWGDTDMAIEDMQEVEIINKSD
jgi:stearoyl-CoA desaturase (Delta-9 desaturase)